MSKEEIISKVKEAIEEDPNKDNIRSISLFGSFLNGNEGVDSDVDLLYETRETMSLFQIAAMRHQLEQKLGRKVDFVNKDSVIPQLKEEIITTAKKIYERK